MQVLHRGAGLSATKRTFLLLPAGRSTASSPKPRAVSRDGGQPTHYQPAALAQLPTPAPRSYACVLTEKCPSTPAAPAGERQHVHTAFGAFYAYLGLMTAAATSPDWHLDFLTFGGLWGLLWAACAKWQPSVSTVTLLCLLPVMHLAGALGLYSWELGNLSWDVLVHISNGFIGTLLFAAVLHDLSSRTASTDIATSNGASSQTGAAGAQPRGASWHERAWGVAKVTALLLLSTSLIEVVEAAGGQVAGHAGDGIFLRGPGDLCTASLPCSEEVDTAKDMVDNCAGMVLALISLATQQQRAEHAHGGHTDGTSSDVRA